MTNVLEMPPGVTRMTVPLRDGSVTLFRGGSGAPVLFLHGAGGAGAWMPFHAKLAEHFDVIAPDHPGFGGSDEFPAINDVHDIALHYADVIEALDLKNVTVVGVSFGGWIAAELAVYRPQLVGKLVLVDAIGLYVDGAPIADTFAMPPAQKVATLVSDPSVLAGLFSAEPSVEEILAMAKEESSFARFAWQPFCHDPRLERHLHRITAPTLVMWGEKDEVAPVAHGYRYAELIPNSTLEILPGKGHALTLECPDELAAGISAFLTNAQA